MTTEEERIAASASRRLDCAAGARVSFVASSSVGSCDLTYDGLKEAANRVTAALHKLLSSRRHVIVAISIAESECLASIVLGYAPSLSTFSLSLAIHDEFASLLGIHFDQLLFVVLMQKSN